MSFNMKIYTCDKCGRTDIGGSGLVHKCPETNITHSTYDINNSEVILNHNLNIKEYDYFNINWALKNFKPLK